MEVKVMFLRHSHDNLLKWNHSCCWLANNYIKRILPWFHRNLDLIKTFLFIISGYPDLWNFRIGCDVVKLKRYFPNVYVYKRLCERNQTISFVSVWPLHYGLSSLKIVRRKIQAPSLIFFRFICFRRKYLIYTFTFFYIFGCELTAGQKASKLAKNQ